MLKKNSRTGIREAQCLKASTDKQSLFFIQDNLLYQGWKQADGHKEVHPLVLHTSYREAALGMTHNSPMAGQTRVKNRSNRRLYSHFH